MGREYVGAVDVQSRWQERESGRRWEVRMQPKAFISGRDDEDSTRVWPGDGNVGDSNQSYIYVQFTHEPVPSLSTIYTRKAVNEPGRIPAPAKLMP